MKQLSLLLPALAVAFPAFANDFEPAMRSYVDSDVVGWVADPVLIDAIRTQNARHSSLSTADIDEMDREWQSQTDSSSRPLIDDVLSNAAADFLRQRQIASAGVISELFVMDNRGLNVAASAMTSDYWQGDEAKFTETFGRPAGTVHVGDVEFDESAQSYLGQVSLPIHDPETGTPIGAITIGLNAEMLF